jgi:hypothetical protein
MILCDLLDAKVNEGVEGAHDTVELEVQILLHVLLGDIRGEGLLQGLLGLDLLLQILTEGFIPLSLLLPGRSLRQDHRCHLLPV